MSVSSGADSSTTTQARARRLHTAVLEAAKSSKSLPTNNHFGEGYLYQGDVDAIAAQVWPELLSASRNKNARRSTSRSFLAEVKGFLKGAGNLVQQGKSWFVRASFNDEGRQVVQHPILGTLGGPLPEVSLAERSKLVWQRARDYCAKGNRPTRTIEPDGTHGIAVVFWECDKPLAYFIRMVYPELTDFEGGKRPIYDFLRATANGVNIGSKHDDDLNEGIHCWLIRDEWNEGGTTQFQFRTLTDRDRREARLSAHDAGEDRAPMPVIITKATQEAVNDMTETPDEEPVNQPAAVAVVAETEQVKCDFPGCNFVGSSVFALAGHKKVHKEDRDGMATRKQALSVLADTIEALAQRDAMISRLQAENAALEELLNEATQVASNDAPERIDVVKDILRRVNQGVLAPFRAFAEIEDALS